MKGKSLFICSTPFQLLSALSICCSADEYADLYVDSQNNGMDIYVERIKQEHIFNSVIKINEFKRVNSIRKTNKLLRSIKMLFSYFRIDTFIQELFCEGFSYVKLYISNNTFLAKYVIQYININKLNIEVIYYDDGEGSYDDNIIDKESLLNRIIKIALGRRVESTEVTRMLYSPDLYKRIRPNSADKLLQLPFYNSKEKITQTLYFIFGLSSMTAIDEKVVLLDTIVSECLPPNEIERYYNLVKRICIACGENIIVKKHPRDRSILNLEYKTYTDNSLPIEMLCMKQPIDDKIIITLTSSSVTSPKLLFGQEPTVILLYRLFHVSIGDAKERETFYSELNKTYKKQKGIIIPQNEDELFSSLIEMGVSDEKKGK